MSIIKTVNYSLFSDFYKLKNGEYISSSITLDSFGSLINSSYRELIRDNPFLSSFLDFINNEIFDTYINASDLYLSTDILAGFIDNSFKSYRSVKSDLSIAKFGYFFTHKTLLFYIKDVLNFNFISSSIEDIRAANSLVSPRLCSFVLGYYIPEISLVINVLSTNINYGSFLYSLSRYIYIFRVLFYTINLKINITVIDIVTGYILVRDCVINPDHFSTFRYSFKI